MKNGLVFLFNYLLLLLASPRGVEPRLQAWKAKTKRTPPDFIELFDRLNPFTGVKSRLKSRLRKLSFPLWLQLLVAQISTSTKRIINIMTNKDNPYIDHTGTIIIPFNADPKYHYWNGGQRLSETLLELNVPEDIWKKHSEKPYLGNTAWTGGVANRGNAELQGRVY